MLSAILEELYATDDDYFEESDSFRSPSKNTRREKGIREAVLGPLSSQQKSKENAKVTDLFPLQGEILHFVSP